MTPSRRRTTCASASRPSGSCSSASPGEPSSECSPSARSRRCTRRSSAWARWSAPCRPTASSTPTPWPGHANTGQTGLVTELQEIGPPPYTSMLDYETTLSSEQEVYPYDHSGNSEGAGGFSENFLVPEYTLVDQVHLLASFMDTFGTLYPQDPGRRPAPGRSHARRPRVLRPRRPRGPGPLRTLRPVVRPAHRTHEGNGGVRPLRAPAALRATRRVRRVHDHARAARYPLRSSRAASGRPLERASQRRLRG